MNDFTSSSESSSHVRASSSIVALLAACVHAIAACAVAPNGDPGVAENPSEATTRRDTTPPTVSLTSPVRLATYSVPRAVTLTADAADNVGVTRVDFYDASTLVGTATSAPFRTTWTVSRPMNGAHTLTAKAYDSAGNVATSTPVSVTVRVPQAELQDAEAYDSATPQPLLPRAMNHDGWGAADNMTLDELSKYQMVNGVGARRFEQLRDQYHSPAIRLRYFSARAYQTPRDSVPIQSTFPGHWLFFAGTTVDNAMDQTMTTVTVHDPSVIVPGQDVMIYDDAVNFGHAEHALVDSVVGTTVTLHARGYRSIPRHHAANSIIATHVNGAVTDPHYWAYNFTPSCPVDPSTGLQWVDTMANWIGEHFDDDFEDLGNDVQSYVGTFDGYDGILWDISPYFGARNFDVNNDLDPDGGIIGEVNQWGQGMDTLFAHVRAQLASRYPGRTMYMLGGVADSRGFQWVNGNQMEGFPINDSRLFEVFPTHTRESYNGIDEQLAVYTHFMHHSNAAPAATQCLNKVPTYAYPNGEDRTGMTNAPFRLAFGLCLLENGFMGVKAGDPWWEEYAVDPVSAVAVPISATDEAKAAHAQWLGAPLGERTRLVAFDPGATLLGNGDFESGVSGWTGSNVGIDSSSTMPLVHRASMHVSRMNNYRSSENGASVSLATPLQLADGQYTLAFAVRATTLRTITVNVGGVEQQFIVGPTWARHVATFDLPAGTTSVSFEVGRENTDVWIDAVYLVRGNVDVFRRDFEHGAVVVNATASPVTVHLETGAFRRFIGQQDGVNDGSSADTLTLNPYDAATLVRR
jgi:hypothetical protein